MPFDHGRCERQNLPSIDCLPALQSVAIIHKKNAAIFPYLNCELNSSKPLLSMAKMLSLHCKMYQGLSAKNRTSFLS